MSCEYDIQKKRPSFTAASESLSFMRKYADVSVIVKDTFPNFMGFDKNISLCLPPLPKAVYVFVPFTMKVSTNFPKKVQGLWLFFLIFIHNVWIASLLVFFSENTEWWEIDFNRNEHMVFSVCFTCHILQSIWKSNPLWEPISTLLGQCLFCCF